MSLTCDFDKLVMPSVATRSFILRVETPFKVAGGDHGGQGALCAGASLE